MAVLYSDQTMAVKVEIKGMKNIKPKPQYSRIITHNKCQVVKLKLRKCSSITKHCENMYIKYFYDSFEPVTVKMTFCSSIWPSMVSIWQV